MARLDAERLAAWTDARAMVERVSRAIDTELQAEWAVPLAWFDVLARLRGLGGAARPQDLADALGIPRATLSRRLDRLAEEGWVLRHPGVDPHDHRAVSVELTPRGRTLWREMNLTYRRAVNRHFPE